MITITRIRPTDVERYREARLRALADSPSAFATKLEDALGIPSDEWQRRADEGADGPDAALFLAVDPAGDVVGMVAGLRNAVEAKTAELVSMWVAPDARRSGAGADLVREIVDWASGSGYESVELWVTRGNDPAERLYRRLGFSETGDVKALPSDPCRDELRMRLDVGAQIS